MEQISQLEVIRKIDYYTYALGKIERHMMTEQSKRIDLLRRLSHLNSLRERVEQIA